MAVQAVHLEGKQMTITNEDPRAHQHCGPKCPQSPKAPRLFNMQDCWSCGEPIVHGCDYAPFTVGCPGCDPQVPSSEKQKDIDDIDLLYPGTYPDVELLNFWNGS